MRHVWETRLTMPSTDAVEHPDVGIVLSCIGWELDERMHSVMSSLGAMGYDVQISRRIVSLDHDQLVMEALAQRSSMLLVESSTMGVWQMRERAPMVLTRPLALLCEMHPHVRQHGGPTHRWRLTTEGRQWLYTYLSLSAEVQAALRAETSYEADRLIASMRSPD